MSNDRHREYVHGIYQHGMSRRMISRSSGHWHAPPHGGIAARDNVDG